MIFIRTIENANKLSLYISVVGVFRKLSTFGLLEVVGYIMEIKQFFTFGYVFEKMCL